MGCTSSTQYTVDPATGDEKKKKKLGGAYPGQRRPQHAPYSPPDSQYQNGQATAHFVAYGGGNALTLQQVDGSTAPQTGGPPSSSQFIQVTIPPGVHEGQTIHVQAPDGRVNAIVVPTGFGPGSTFTVEFAPETPQTSAPPASSGPPPGQSSLPDDGFATGFNNPNWRPPAPAPVAASAPYEVVPLTEEEIDLNAYPSATATAVQSPPSASNNYNTYKPSY